jgi:aspartate/methionine/tyrosine aminotransferase
VSKKTRLIVVTNPNQIYGQSSTSRRWTKLLRVARRPGLWLLVMKIYRGARVTGRSPRHFWGRYDKLLITLDSPGFGLPGLRWDGSWLRRRPSQAFARTTITPR